ncbi:MAG: MarR family transcriptional regulator [Rhodospirillales bacterium]|nr:MarR family transcriptional regulator [Rhodospirillales bacterium]
MNASDKLVPLTSRGGLELWHRTLVSSVRSNLPDLSVRQMAILLTVYLTPPPHTVRGLASALGISKAAVTRGLNRLAALDFVRRKVDDDDRRSINVQRTVRGSVFLHDYGEMIAAHGDGRAVP